MPFTIERRDGRWLVIDEAGEAVGAHEARTDAIKQQRALAVSFERDSVVAALTYEEPVEEIDPRLQNALDRLEELTEREKNVQPVRISVSPDTQVTEALIATLDQISERLTNGEAMTESLVASLRSISEQPAPVVNVAAPNYTAPDIHVNVPETVVNVPAPVVNVQAPVVNVPAAEVTVMLPEEKERKVTFIRDPMGRLEGAEVTEE